MCGYLFVPVFCCEMCKTGNTCQRGHNFSGVWSCLELSCCDPAQISPLLSSEQIWLLSILQLIFCIITFFHLSADFSLSEWWLWLMLWLSLQTLQGMLGSAAALSSAQPPIPQMGTGQTPLSSGALTGCWIFLNSAVTSVYIPLFTVSWEQKRIPNFLHSNFACGILMRFSLTLQGLLSGFVEFTEIHNFYSLNHDSLSFFLPFHPVPIRMLLSVGYSLFLMIP